MESLRVRRNDLCPCGSGKKYKRCCLSAVQARMMPPRPVQRNGDRLVFHQTPAQMAAAKERAAVPPPMTAASPIPPGKAEPGKEQLIRGTAEHPFYVYGKGWTPLGELKPGDWIRTDDGWVSVDKVEDTGKYETVYNLRVADYHTYFVGAQDWGYGVWAHNSYGSDLAYPANRGRLHSVYGDGTRVYGGQKPPYIVGPDPAAQGRAHSVLRWDTTPRRGDMMVPASQRTSPRVYQAREFDAAGNPVRDIDFTVPVTPAGVPYPGHTFPHQHRWIPNDPANPAAGFRRGGPEAL